MTTKKDSQPYPVDRYSAVCDVTCFQFHGVISVWRLVTPSRFPLHCNFVLKQHSLTRLRACHLHVSSHGTLPFPVQYKIVN